MRKRLLAFLMVLCLCQMPQMVWAAEVTEKMPQGTETEKLTEAETVPESEKQTETEKNQSESEQTESNQSAVIFQIDDTHIYAASCGGRYESGLFCDSDTESG